MAYTFHAALTERRCKAYWLSQNVTACPIGGLSGTTVTLIVEVENEGVFVMHDSRYKSNDWWI